MQADRKRLVSPLGIAGFGAAVTLSLAAVFPRGTLERALLESREADTLTVAYLRAWLRADPNNAGAVEHLAREYIDEGRYDDAERLVAQLRASSDADVKQRAILADIGIAERRLYSLPEGAPERIGRIAKLDALLSGAVDVPWPALQLQLLAVKALALNDGGLAARYYHRLASREPMRATYWLGKESAAQLASGHYREAADASFAASARAASKGEQRAFFFAGLRALQGGNLLGDAMLAAREHIGELANDARTLRFLISLSLAAGRPDLASDYTNQLVKLHGASKHAEAAPSAEHHAADAPHIMFAVWRGSDRARIVRVAQAANVQSVQPSDEEDDTAAPAPGKAAGNAAGKAGDEAAPSDDELAYKVYLQNSKLREAEEVARNALARDPGSVPWHERLAQVATWNNRPRVALDAYLWLAKTRNDEASWQQVLRLAPALRDDRALLAAMQHELDRSGGKVDRRKQLEWIDAYVAIEEGRADPGAAIRFLAMQAHGALRQPVLERTAALAERTGDDALALRTWQTLEHDYGPNSAYATKIAVALYGQHRYADALAALEKAKPATEGGADTVQYWRLYATLGKLAGKPDVVVEGSRHLLKSGRETPTDLEQMIDALDTQPLDAGRVAEYAYRRTGELRDLRRAVYYYTRARAYERIRTLLDSLTPAQAAVAERDPDYLMARSQYWRLVGEPARALDDVRAVLRIQPDNANAQVALIWLLNDSGSDTELRAALRTYRSHATGDTPLTAAYAAAYLRLGDARAALHFLRQNLPSHRDDVLWRLTVADALELSGQTDEAWQIRRTAWKMLHRERIDVRRPSRMTPDEYDMARVRFIALTDRFAGGDASKRLLIELLRKDEQANAAPASKVETDLGDLSMLPPATAASLARRNAHYSAAAREAMLAWSQSHDAYDFERDWLAWHYTERLSQPYYANAALALADDNTAKLSQMLDDPADPLPTSEKIAAEQGAGRVEAAQQDAAQAQNLLPDNDAMHATYVDSVLPTAQAIAPGFRYLHTGPLLFYETSIGAGVRITPTLAFAFRYVDRAQHGDTSLPGVPGKDRNFEGVLRRYGTIDREALVIGRRDALRDFTTVRIEGSLFDGRPLSFTYSIGRNQEATESAQLQVGGVKDNVAAAVAFQPDPHIFTRARVEYARFLGQDRSYLGHGTLITADGGYKLRIAYPDFTVRVAVTHGEYTANGSPGALLQQLVPNGEPLTASQFVSSTFTQVALLAGFGNGLIDGYSRRWRPFLEVGPLYDSHAKWGERVTAGVVGSVIGNDQAGLYITHASASANHSTPFTEVGIRYRWMY
ncbi:tetratricopeptide repeat protein [Burkholderia sp. PU8-34]